MDKRPRLQGQGQGEEEERTCDYRWRCAGRKQKGAEVERWEEKHLGKGSSCTEGSRVKKTWDFQSQTSPFKVSTGQGKVSIEEKAGQKVLEEWHAGNAEKKSRRRTSFRKRKHRSGSG